jgi:protein-disulfide isomerase
VLLTATAVAAARPVSPPAIRVGQIANAPEKTDETPNTVADVEALLGGIPEERNGLGSPTAPVTLEWFGDLECPICRDFALGSFPRLVNRWVRTGKLRVVYRALETATREPETFREQQVAALAAGAQMKMWYFVDLFYREQGEEDSGYVNNAYLEGLARQVPGLELAGWRTARKNPRYVKQLLQDVRSANEREFAGTPSFLIGRTGTRLARFETPSLTNPTRFNQTIARLLTR